MTAHFGVGLVFFQAEIQGGFRKKNSSSFWGGIDGFQAEIHGGFRKKYQLVLGWDWCFPGRTFPEGKDGGRGFPLGTGTIGKGKMG